MKKKRRHVLLPTWHGKAQRGAAGSANRCPAQRQRQAGAQRSAQQCGAAWRGGACGAAGSAQVRSVCATVLKAIKRPERECEESRRCITVAGERGATRASRVR